MTKHPIKIYADTSVYGGIIDEEFAEGILTEKWYDDALHVALATIAECNVIVSWNFKHIVNFRKIPLFNAVNMLNGYRQIAIHSPLEVINYEE